MNMEKVFSLWDSTEGKSIQVYGKKNGQEWKAICPKHSDTDPSLSINEVKGLYKCFACEFKGSLYDASKTNIRKIIATYDYTDQEGNLLYQTVRHDPKDFRQRRPDGNGGWIWNLQEIETVLYRLPEILKSDEVIVVEGEKDADNLSLLGFCGTTCPMGAGKWRPHFNKVLEGKNIILCPDNDEPGRKHMVMIAESLNGTTKSLKSIDLPSLEEKGDVTDFILKYSDPEDAKKEILRLIEQTPPYKLAQKKTIEDIILTTQDFHDLQFPRRAYFLYPWLADQQIILITGERGLGKSFLGHGIAGAISQGKNLGPWEFMGSGPILIIGVPSEGQNILTGGSPVLVGARAM